MANQEQVDILEQGVDVWNEWRKKNPDVGIDLSGADLSGADLHGAKLSHANISSAKLDRAVLYGVGLVDANLVRTNFQGADLSGSVLSGANFTDTDLSYVNFFTAILHGAILHGANLLHTSFFEADLTGVHFTGARLTGTLLSNAHLDDVNLSDAELAYTVFERVDLSTVKGLETVKHHGPSTISIDTIYRSQGKIPEVFLKKTGVPDSFIEYMRSLVGSPIGYYSCFISYSSKDQAFAERLYADLQSKGIRCWFAPHDIKIGDKFRSRIDEAVRIYDKLLLVLSEHSIRSPWVEKEVEGAFEKERKRKKLVLFPVRLNDTIKRTRQAWAADIRRTRHIGDFTRWKDHDEYQQSFARLLRDLQAQ